MYARTAEAHVPDSMERTHRLVRRTKTIESAFERGLWSSRYAVMLAVIASMTAAMAMFFVATVDVTNIALRLPGYVAIVLHSGKLDAAEAQHEALRTQTIVHVVEVIDGYLLATVLLLFAFGLYGIFISRIDVAERNKLGQRLLIIHNLDDLKDRLAKVVILILIVKFFENALKTEFVKPPDLAYLAVGVALLALALFLSHHDSEAESR